MPDYKQREGWEKSQAATVFVLLQKWLTRVRSGADAWDRASFIEDGVELLSPAIVRPYARSSQTLADKYKLTLPASMKPGKWAERFAKQFTRELATNVAADLRGLGKHATREDVELIFNRDRARRAGATAVTQAISAGEIDAAVFIEKTKGSKLQVRWQRDRSSNTCKVCWRLNGKLSSYFTIEFPMGPPAHPYCRCYLEFS